MLDCTVSMVVYKNPSKMVRDAAATFLESDCSNQFTVVDNSPTPELRSAFEGLPVLYKLYGENAGYGKGHNWGIFNSENSKYHLVLNPDIIIPPSAINRLIEFMDQNPDIGIVSPKILNEDASTQFLNKRYPRVSDLFARRFLPKSLHFLIQKKLDLYEMKDVGYEEVCDVDCVSGCFMFCRTDLLKAVGGFDDRYFMYFEDFDLSRKVQQAGFRTVFYPHTAVIHLWERASHKSMKMTWVFVNSMFRYFHKWGWKF